MHHGHSQIPEKARNLENRLEAEADVTVIDQYGGAWIIASWVCLPEKTMAKIISILSRSNQLIHLSSKNDSISRRDLRKVVTEGSFKSA